MKKEEKLKSDQNLNFETHFNVVLLLYFCTRFSHLICNYFLLVDKNMWKLLFQYLLTTFL